MLFLRFVRGRSGGSLAGMIVADTHLHLYPHYDFARAIQGCVDRLSALAPGATCAGFLAERSDCRVYRALKEGGGGPSSEEIDVSLADDGVCLVLRSFNRPALYLFPGRQIVTEERLELLCLTSDADIPDGLPAEIAVNRIREVGGVPVLTWAVGKWLFGRAHVVRALLEQFGPSELVLGDSAMRPVFWPTPGPMRTGRQRGYRLLAGTDPLPADGEERVMGRYASVLELDFDPVHACTSLRSALLDDAIALRTVGARSNAIEFVRRMTSGT
jgi:hypothetical protein